MDPSCSMPPKVSVRDLRIGMGPGGVLVVFFGVFLLVCCGFGSCLGGFLRTTDYDSGGYYWWVDWV